MIIEFCDFFFLYHYEFMHFNIFVFRSIAVIFILSFPHLRTLGTSCWCLSHFAMTTFFDVAPGSKARKLIILILYFFCPTPGISPFSKECWFKQEAELRLQSEPMLNVSELIVLTMSWSFYSEVYFVNEVKLITFTTKSGFWGLYLFLILYLAQES